MGYWSADVILTRFNDYGPVLRMIGNPSCGPGVHTGNKEKIRYCYILNEVMNDKRLFFAENLVGTNPSETLKKLKSQLEAHEIDIKESTDPTKEAIIRITGKKGGKIDDLATTIQMLIFWTDTQCRKIDFRQYLVANSHRLYVG